MRGRRTLAACAALLAASAVAASATEQGSFLHVVVRYPYSNMQPGDALFLRGDGMGLNWKSGMRLQDTGATDTWSLGIPVPTPAPANLSVKVLVDDQQWQLGANDIIEIASWAGPGGEGGNRSYTLYPWFATGKGEYKYIRDVYSPQLRNTRDLVVYTPPSYTENPYKQYDNVIIMHDGENLFNASTSFGGIAWECQGTVDQLVIEGSMEEVIIVGVDNTLNRTSEYTYSYDKTVKDGGNANTYLDYLEQTVMPLIAKRYRITPAPPAARPAAAADTAAKPRGQWAMIGSSLGGLLSCYAGWTRSPVYGKVGCMSSSFWWNSDDFNNTVLEKPASPRSDTTFYVDSGSAGPGDDDEVETQAVRDHFARMGWTLGSDLFYYLDKGGQHNEYYWGHRFHEPMNDLFPPRAHMPAPGAPAAV